MLAISFKDLQLISALSELSEFQMLEIDNDPLIYSYLHKIGMDTDYPICYAANKHRTLSGEVVTGFRAYGEVRIDVDYRNSYLAGITERLVCASYLDPSLMTEIAELSFKTRSWSDALNDNDSLDWQEDRAVMPVDQLEEDWEAEEKKIAELNDILVSIRGPVYNSSGALKTMEEYKEFAENRNYYEEKYDTN